MAWSSKKSVSDVMSAINNNLHSLHGDNDNDDNDNDNETIDGCKAASQISIQIQIQIQIRNISHTNTI